MILDFSNLCPIETRIDELKLLNLQSVFSLEENAGRQRRENNFCYDCDRR